MAQNADPVVDDDKKVDEEDLRKLKYPDEEVESPKGTDETSDEEETEEDSEDTGEDEGKTDDEAEDEDSEEESEDADKTEDSDTSDEEDSEFVKEFPNIKGDTLEDYTRSLEQTIQESNREGKRLADRVKDLEAKTGKPKEDSEEESEEKIDLSDPLRLWAKQNLDKEIDETYKEFSKSFPQVKDDSEYDKFKNTVSVLSRTIMESEKRMAPPKELYSKAAVTLGWEPQDAPSDKEKLSMAVKNKAAVSKTTSSSKKKGKKSKVTDAMVAANRAMYPDKSDADIREELEPYV
jgi:hypothetical protein